MDIEYDIRIRIRKRVDGDAMKQFAELRRVMLQWIDRHGGSGEITMMSSSPPAETDQEQMDGLEREQRNP